MEKFALSTDSCCDEFKTNLKKSNIYCLLMEYVDGDNVCEDNFDSLQEYKYFYDEMKCGKTFSTMGLNPEQLKNHFEDILKKENKDIIHISLSSGLSGTCDHAKKVADEINKTSKNKIYVLDSLSATQGQNFLVAYAKKMRDENASVEETLDKLKKIISKLSVSFFITDLETLKRGGRISGAKAMIGKLMSLRPMLRFDKEGKLEVYDKALGTKKAVLNLFNHIAKNIDTSEAFPVFLAFAGEGLEAIQLKNLIEEKLNIHNVIIGPLGPVIASHTGPTLTGLIFVSK